MIFLTMLPKRDKKSEPVELPEAEDDTEEKRILRWRRLQLARAGYSMRAATALADARHVDLEDARKLITRTTEELAVNILM